MERTPGTGSTTATPGSLGVNLIGHVSGNFGLGVAARSTAMRLLAWGHPVTVVDIDPGDGRARRDLSFLALEREGACRQPLNLFHMNPLKIVKFARQWRPRASLRSTNVCVPFWEMPHLPLDWLPVLEVMDAVMAPSRFILRAVEKGLPGVPVLSYPQTIFVPPGVRADRPRWGNAAEVVIFLVAFDPFSGTVRKNPAGAVEAFQRAFRSGERVELVIKVNRSRKGTKDQPDRELHGLAEAARSDRRIRIVDESLPYADVLSLYASADVVVSLHRAEGLGLHLMEAMTLGKPVIATGWSGNTDFMAAENSCLVGYRLDRVKPDGRVAARESLRAEQVWAEPDLEEAAAWMRRLASSAALRSEIGGGQRARCATGRRRRMRRRRFSRSQGRPRSRACPPACAGTQFSRGWSGGSASQACATVGGASPRLPPWREFRRAAPRSPTRRWPPVSARSLR